MTSEDYYDHVIVVGIIFTGRWHTIDAFFCRDGSVVFIRAGWPMKQKEGDFAKALWNAPVVRLSDMREDWKLGKMKSLLVYWMMCAGHIDAFIVKGPVSQDKLQAAMDVLAKGHMLPDVLGKRAASPVGDGEGEGEMEGGREGKKPRLADDDSDLDSSAGQVSQSDALAVDAGLSAEDAALVAEVTQGMGDDE